MKNKKITVVIIGVVIFCICFITGAIILKCNSGYKNTDLLLKGLEKAVNNTDDRAIVKCYPSFIQKSLPAMSHHSMEEFHNKVGDISFNVLNRNKCESDDIIDKQNELNTKYNCNIELEEYVLVTCKYDESFGETTFEMIKIDGLWYLYYDAYLPEPMQYFVK